MRSGHRNRYFVVCKERRIFTDEKMSSSRMSAKRVYDMCVAALPYTFLVSDHFRIKPTSRKRGCPDRPWELDAVDCCGTPFFKLF
jgi:hypothetical protein